MGPTNGDKGRFDRLSDLRNKVKAKGIALKTQDIALLPFLRLAEVAQRSGVERL
ncbi:MAG: hypothetical protein ABFD63_11615 [Smithella sp.]